jgi:putative colanic acid biosynthesis acetyltransferase WcaF
MKVDLSLTSSRDYHPGRGFPIRALWLVVEALVMLNPLVTPYGPKAALLRLFGAKVGRNVVIKPNVHIKYPWRLSIGDNCWLGERSWIDNFVEVRLGDNVCISQGAYLCTGNHDWSDPGMGLVVKPIVVDDGAWIAAFARVAPGVTVGEEAVVTLGAVLLKDAEPRGVYGGNPAVKVSQRSLRDHSGMAELAVLRPAA